MTVLKELAELIQACKDIKKRQTHKSWVHVDDIAETLQKIIDDEFARANRTFDQVAIDEVIEANDPKPPKTGFGPCEDGSTEEDDRREREHFLSLSETKESDQWEEWGSELAQLRAAHIKNAKNKRLEIAVGMGSDDSWACGHDPFISSCQGLCASPKNNKGNA